jgi:hypothetical protein
MKGFFQGLNLARVIILVSLVGSLVLGWLCWQRSSELSELKDAVDTRMTPTITALMQAAQRHTQLSQSLKGEGLQGQKDFLLYIRQVAAKDKVEVGELNMTAQDTPLSNGVVDKKYTMKPDSTTATFKRMTLVNFFYSLEKDSRRVKVTRLKIETADKGLKTHEIPSDNWRFDAEVTSRQRKG